MRSCSTTTQLSGYHDHGTGVDSARRNTLMAFWNGEKLLERLPALVHPFRKADVDCAAYTLSIGREIYVSPTDETADPKRETLRTIAERASFTIPPGQFAFLLTEQVVTVPDSAI